MQVQGAGFQPRLWAFVQAWGAEHKENEGYDHRTEEERSTGQHHSAWAEPGTSRTTHHVTGSLLVELYRSRHLVEGGI